jgi:hypothetical protein
MCGACVIAKDIIVFPGARTAKPGLARRIEEATAGLSEHAASAVALGMRVDRYLAAQAAQTSDEHVQLWPELNEALTVWAGKHGNPWASLELRKLAEGGHASAERFLQAFTRAGRAHRRARDEADVDAALRRPGRRPRRARRVGLPDQHHLTVGGLADALVEQTHVDRPAAQLTVTRRLPELLDAGWFLDGDAWDELVPERDYLTGHLWPKHDRAVALVDKHAPANVVRNGRCSTWCRRAHRRPRRAADRGHPAGRARRHRRRQPAPGLDPARARRATG